MFSPWLIFVHSADAVSERWKEITNRDTAPNMSSNKRKRKATERATRKKQHLELVRTSILFTAWTNVLNSIQSPDCEDYDYGIYEASKDIPSDSGFDDLYVDGVPAIRRSGSPPM
jgi:hypothetical protein